MATGEKKTQDIQKATEVLPTDLLLSTTNPASGNPENKNIKIELLKEFISKGDLRYEEDYGNASEHEGKE